MRLGARAATPLGTSAQRGLAVLLPKNQPHLPVNFRRCRHFGASGPEPPAERRRARRGARGSGRASSTWPALAILAAERLGASTVGVSAAPACSHSLRSRRCSPPSLLRAARGPRSAAHGPRPAHRSRLSPAATGTPAGTAAVAVGLQVESSGASALSALPCANASGEAT